MSRHGIEPPVLSSHPVDVGQRTEGAILAHLINAGYSVLLPWGVNQRYDLVLDLGGSFVRAQCKTGRIENGALIFATCSIVTNKTSNVRRGYTGEADVFLVTSAGLGRVFCVPVSQAPVGHMYLRLEPSRNGQRHGVHWASEYELPG
jgi:hypothetical protein